MKKNSTLYCVFTLTFSVLSVLLFSCDNNKNENQEEAEKSEVKLTEKTLYDYYLVKKVIRASRSDNKQQGKALFKEAIKEYKKEKNINQSIAFIKKSICLYPMPASYYELGNLTLSLRSLAEAEKAFKMAEQLNYKHLDKLYYKLSKVYSLQNNLEEANAYLKLAVEKGYRNIKMIASDTSFKNLKNTQEYRELVAESITNVDERRLTLFSLFVVGFPESGLPFSIDYNKATVFNYDKYIPYDYEELLHNTLPSDESKEFSYVAKVSCEPDKFVTLIYAAIDATEEGQSVVEHYLAVFHKDGRLIDKKLFACNCSTDVILTGKIDEKQEVNLTEYRNIWKYDPSSTNASENEIIAVAIKANYQFKITEQGRIAEVEKKAESVMARL